MLCLLVRIASSLESPTQLLCRKLKRFPSIIIYICFLTSGSNYQYLEQISVTPKMFEPLKSDCILDTVNPRYNDNICSKGCYH